MKILPFVLMVLLLFSFSTIFFNSAKYQDSVLCNKYRATMEDYPTKDWDEVADILTKEGITKSEYEMVQRWCLADTDVITTDKLESLVLDYDETFRSYKQVTALRGVSGFAVLKVLESPDFKEMVDEMEATLEELDEL
jgi:hypothetical protein